MFDDSEPLIEACILPHATQKIYLSVFEVLCRTRYAAYAPCEQPKHIHTCTRNRGRQCYMFEIMFTNAYTRASDTTNMHGEFIRIRIR